MKIPMKPSKTQDYIEPRSIMNDYEKLTAHEARTRYKPPYTLQAILDHVLRNCSFSQEIYGYERSRFPDSLFLELRDLGYHTEVYPDLDKGVPCVKISWKEEK